MTHDYGSDKRKFHRLSTPLEAVVVILSPTEAPRGLSPMHLQCRNISPEGICLEAKTLEVSGLRLLEGPPGARENRLQISLALFPGEPDLKAIGEVRWYDLLRGDDGSLYQLGVQFLEIEAGEKERLHQFLKGHQPQGIMEKLFR